MTGSPTAAAVRAQVGAGDGTEPAVPGVGRHLTPATTHCVHLFRLCVSVCVSV